MATATTTTTMTITLESVDLMASTTSAIPSLNLSDSSPRNDQHQPPSIEDIGGERDDLPEYSAYPRPDERIQMEAPPPRYTRLHFAPGVCVVRFMGMEDMPADRLPPGVEVAVVEDIKLRVHSQHNRPSRSRMSRFWRNCRQYRLQLLGLIMLLAITLGVVLSRCT